MKIGREDATYRNLQFRPPPPPPPQSWKLYFRDTKPLNNLRNGKFLVNVDEPPLFPANFPSNFRFIGVTTGISPHRQSSCYSIFIQKRHDSRSSSKKTPYFEKLLFSSLSLKISTPPHVDSGPLIFHYLRDPPLFPTFSTLEPAGSFDVVATQLLATARPNIFLEVGRVRGRTIHVWNHICE